LVALYFYKKEEKLVDIKKVFSYASRKKQKKRGIFCMVTMVTICLSISNIVLIFTIMLLLLRKKTNGNETLEKNVSDMQSKMELLNSTIMTQTSIIGENIRKDGEGQRRELSDALALQRSELKSSMDSMANNLHDIRLEIKGELKDIQSSNRESLDKINDTVNEKLQKTLDDRISQSFKTVQEQLAEVYKGLGEMKNLASGVSDLKNVLSNVKTRGIVGEYQLEAILSEILTNDQYEVQFAVTPNSSERVDFAIKLPGNGEQYVYLPIDSKFPGDAYANLASSIDTGSREEIDLARKQLRSTVLSEAKSIRDKYIDPPYTTDFAIMFLPFEGLYAEVVNMGMVEELQSKYNVNIAGPSTMAAMLNSFRMGFRTLAIQKRSGEVWTVLEAVKKEFGTFEEGLRKMKDRIRQTDDELEKLIGTRTNVINRKLKSVTTSLSLQEADDILGIESDS
jgi:DNA recombination protein RmuC